MQFCIWHNSCAVVACAKFCNNHITYDGVTLKAVYHLILIKTEKSFTNWTPGLKYNLFWLLSVVYVAVTLWFKSSHHGGCWWPGVCSMPGHLQPSWWHSCRAVNTVKWGNFEHFLSLHVHCISHVIWCWIWVVAYHGSFYVLWYFPY